MMALDSIRRYGPDSDKIEGEREGAQRGRVEWSKAGKFEGVWAYLFRLSQTIECW